ncbi:endoglucanase F-like [Saccoglossus kowalevskii]|uniref:cellulase n=1 Tax=Saccoglossus kowalevskii TaxID=10224 RepID=A0ABM0GXJ3_SACKO|nr:PREDICTED: endoglucanase 23-like [Saccoglossus kowalevskii]
MTSAIHLRLLVILLPILLLSNAMNWIELEAEFESVERWPWSGDDEADSSDRILGIRDNQNNTKATVKRDSHSERKPPSTEGHYDYSEVIHLSIRFYEAQRSGQLPSNKRIAWRGHSALNDKGKSRVEDLIGGWYDGGGNMKFVFPMAYSATVLAWGMIEYKDTYDVAGLTPYMMDSLKWAYDFFIKCHAKRNRLFYQIGDVELEKTQWNRPEDSTMDAERPAFYADMNNPASDVAATVSASFATCYLIFKDKDPEYASICLNEAKDLYRFATQFPGRYQDMGSYASTDHIDDMVWAAAWLYRATNDNKYMDDAKRMYDESYFSRRSFAFGWDDKRPGVNMLMCILTGENQYRDYLVRYLQSWLPGERVQYTPKGLAWRVKKTPLRYTAATAFLALMAADYGIEAEVYRSFAVRQIHYMLGDSERSFVVGYGHKSPTRPRHRASSCPDLSLPCTWQNSFRWDGPNHHTLYGALVGGPDVDDSFEDSRVNVAQSSVSCDQNAGFQSALAGLRHLELRGHEYVYASEQPMHKFLKNPLNMKNSPRE